MTLWLYFEAPANGFWESNCERKALQQNLYFVWLWKIKSQLNVHCALKEQSETHLELFSKVFTDDETVSSEYADVEKVKKQQRMRLNASVWTI